MPVINGSSFFVDGKRLYLEMLTVNTFLSTVNIIKMQVLTVNTFSIIVVKEMSNIEKVVNGKHNCVNFGYFLIPHWPVKENECN